MTKHLFNLRFVLIIGIFNLLFSSATMADNKLPNPIIKAGTAKLSGSVSNLKPSKDNEKLIAEITVYNPITGESSYKTSLDKENRFSIDVPLQSSKAIVAINIRSDNNFYFYCNIGLEQEKETQINISFDDKGEMKINTKGGLDLTFDDLMRISKGIFLFESNHDYRADYYKMTPKEFADYTINKELKERINEAIDSIAPQIYSTFLNNQNYLSEAIDSIAPSEKTKKHLINSLTLRYFDGMLFDYKSVAELSFEESDDDYTAVEPNKNYYSFLRKYNLNDPQYLYCYSYNGFIKDFLLIKAFNIPKIGNTPVEEWLKGVKNSVKNTIGFDSGLFYDMLAANAYDIQMSYDNKTLTNKQLINIRNYFKADKKDIADILLKENKERVKTLKDNKNFK